VDRLLHRTSLDEGTRRPDEKGSAFSSLLLRREMRILLPMRRSQAIVLREHYVRDLVVSQDHDIVRIIVVTGEDHYEGWIVTDKDVLDLLRETDTYVTVKTVFASKQGRTNLKREERRCKPNETGTQEHPQSEET
jgi:hypothetical protein